MSGAAFQLHMDCVCVIPAPLPEAMTTHSTGFESVSRIKSSHVFSTDLKAHIGAKWHQMWSPCDIYITWCLDTSGRSCTSSITLLYIYTITRLYLTIACINFQDIIPSGIICSAWTVQLGHTFSDTFFAMWPVSKRQPWNSSATTRPHKAPAFRGSRINRSIRLYNFFGRDINLPRYFQIKPSDIWWQLVRSGDPQKRIFSTSMNCDWSPNQDCSHCLQHHGCWHPNAPLPASWHLRECLQASCLSAFWTAMICCDIYSFSTMTMTYYDYDYGCILWLHRNLLLCEGNRWVNASKLLILLRDGEIKYINNYKQHT